MPHIEHQMSTATDIAITPMPMSTQHNSFVTSRGCRGRANKSIGLKFWWLSHQNVGSSPGHDTCVHEQDT